MTNPFNQNWMINLLDKMIRKTMFKSEYYVFFSDYITQIHCIFPGTDPKLPENLQKAAKVFISDNKRQNFMNFINNRVEKNES